MRSSHQIVTVFCICFHLILSHQHTHTCRCKYIFYSSHKNVEFNNNLIWYRWSEISFAKSDNINSVLEFRYFFVFVFFFISISIFRFCFESKLLINRLICGFIITVRNESMNREKKNALGILDAWILQHRQKRPSAIVRLKRSCVVKSIYVTSEFLLQQTIRILMIQPTMSHWKAERWLGNDFTCAAVFGKCLCPWISQ